MPTFRWPLKLVVWVVSHPRLTLVGAGAAMAICAALAATSLRLSSNQNDLFSPDAPYFRDYLRFIELFPENEAIYVVLQARGDAEVPTERWAEAADRIAERLDDGVEGVRSVDHRVPIERVAGQALLLADRARIQEALADVRRFMPLVRLWAGDDGAGLADMMGATPVERFASSLLLTPIDAEAARFIEAAAESWTRALERGGESDGSLGRVGTPDLRAMGAADPSGLGYYFLPDRTEPERNLLLIRVYAESDYDSLTAISNVVVGIRAAVDEAAGAFPEFHAGLTGRPVLEADQMRTTERDTHRAEAVALVAVFFGLLVLLRSFWLTVVAEIGLVVAIVWTLGFATVSLGELNLLSIVFLIALIGIGMDSLIQILSRYRVESRRSSGRVAWVRVFTHVGPAVTTACLGASAAFLVALLTDFRGAAELGLIAGVGLALCLVSGFTVVPALLTLRPARVRARREGAPADPNAGRRRGSLLLIVLWPAALLAGAPAMTGVGFNAGLLDLQVDELESVRLVRTLQTWFIVALAEDPEQIERAERTLRGAETVERTESLAAARENAAWLRDPQRAIAPIEWKRPQEMAPDRVERFSRRIETLAARLERAAVEGEGPAQRDAAESLRAFASALDEATPEAGADAISAWQSAFTDRLRDLVAPFQDPSLDVSALPESLRRRFVAQDGTAALYIYPRADLWSHENLAPFVEEVEGRLEGAAPDVTVTGIASNIHHTTAGVRSALLWAAGLALAAVALLVVIDLRSLPQTLGALSVLALGLPMLLALMGWFGIDWNLANFFGLPILIGAGHEYGVFMIHRYREARADPRRVWRGWDVSDQALLLCAFVTSSSFGFFGLLARHEGLQSLGLVMAMGAACIYLAAVVVLRPILRRLAARAHPEAKRVPAAYAKAA